MFGANYFGEGYFAQGYAGAIAITVTLGQASDTDLAQAVAWSPKSRLAGQAAETDLAQAVVAPHIRLIGQASEVATHPAYGIDGYGGGLYGGGPYSGYGAIHAEKTKTLGQAVETDSVTALTYSATKRAIVSWAEMSLPVGVTSDTLGQATETDSAQAVTVLSSLVIGRAYEQGPLYPSATTIPGEIFPLANSGALPIFATASHLIGQALETDLAQAVGVNTAIGQATESDSAQAITEVKGDVLGQALETDTAQSLAGGNVRKAVVSWAEISMPAGAPLTAIGQAQEIELAQAIAVAQAQAPQIAAAGLIFLWGDQDPVGLTAVVGQVQETELAQALVLHKTLAIGQAAETDTAQAVSSFRFFPVGQAEETDTAQAITAVGGGVPITVGRTDETDLAQPVTWKLVRLVGQIEEVDVALDVIVIGGFTLGYEDCDDLNLIPEPDFAALYPSALTYPSSVTYPSEGADQLANPLPEGSDALVLVPA